jgi:hypothetical protein
LTATGHRKSPRKFHFFLQKVSQLWEPISFANCNEMSWNFLGWFVW